MTQIINIDGVEIGGNNSCYVIAEMSANHNGKIEEALKIIHAAKDSGADAVKLQTYRADTITLNSSKADFCLPNDSPWEGHNTLYALYEKAFTPWEWHAELFAEARKIGITIFSSPFDFSSIDLLESLNTPAYKIASPEITDIPLIKRIAETGKPVLVSTGLANLDDIELAVHTLTTNGCTEFAILRCTTAYPAPASETNLALLLDIAERFNCVVGLSDHSLGQAVPLAALHYGSKILEKHFVLNHSDSVDGFFSLDATSFKELIANLKITEDAIGVVDYAVTPSAQSNIFARRSLYISADVKAGDIITSDNIKSVRPSYGLHPKYYDAVLGKRFNHDRETGDRLAPDDISDFHPDDKGSK